MISQGVILEEIDNGCYGCYAKGTDGSKIKNNDAVKELLVKEIKTLEDLGSIYRINEYEVDKAFLDKMRYIKEHKNETDNLIYTGGLDFFERLRLALERNLQGGLYQVTEKVNEERDKFMEQYEVPKAPDIEIPEAVLKNLDADDAYILYDDTSSFSGYIVYSTDCANRIYDTDGNLRGDKLVDRDALEHDLRTNKKFYLDKYNILYLMQE